MLTFKGMGFSYAEGGEVVYSCGPNGMTDSEFKVGGLGKRPS